MRGAIVLLTLLATVRASAQGYSVSQTRSLGQLGVANVGSDPQELNVRVQWIAPGYYWGKFQAPLAMSWVEFDVSRAVTLRVTAGGGTSWDESRSERAYLLMGDVNVFFHGYRLERIMEHVTLDYDYSSSTQQIGGQSYRHTQSREQYVNVPGYRLRMTGVNAGVFAWRSLGPPVDDVSGDVPTFIGAAYLGYSNAWVKSNAYMIQGYGYAGRARYHRVFVDLMVAPIRMYDVDVDDPPGLFGGRVGVENIWGKPTGFSLRFEVGIMPGGLDGYLLFLFGVGSNLHVGG